MIRASFRIGRRILKLGIWSLALWTIVIAPVAITAQADKDKVPSPVKDASLKFPGIKGGLTINDPKAFQGYTLLAPLRSKTTYLLDMQGKVAKSWEGAANPALVPYLLENGNLLRPTELTGNAKKFKGIGPGMGGRIQEFDWNGDIVWDFTFVSETRMPHHDITRLPNGNIMMIVWENRTKEEAIAAGRRPTAIGSHLQPDSLVEIKPTGKTTGEIVWEWRLWDHLVQDADETKANFGKVAEHPELVDINFGTNTGPAAPKKDGPDKEKDKEKEKGKDDAVKTPPKAKGGANPDWTHFNGVAYNPELDQLIVSVHAFSEFWIIDHSTTTAEAASHKGGKSGKGGDLLYRWGNPRVYAAGDRKDQRLFAQHNAHWIPKGLPGAGHILVYNNGPNRPDGAYSSVDELVLPVDAEGRYSLTTGSAYGPEKADWSYTAPKKADFFSSFISGAQRLPNGNTLICAGASGTIFEVTPEKEVVWKYRTPTRVPTAKAPDGKAPDGTSPDGKDPQLVQVLPAALQDALKLTDEQKKQLLELQKNVVGELDKILTEEQRKQLKSMQAGPAGSPPVGAVPAPPGGGGGGPTDSSLFRAYRFAASYPGLQGRDLIATKTVEELLMKSK